MEYRSEIRRNKILVHETATWRLRSLLLRTEAWKRRSRYRMYDSIYTHVRKGKTVGTEPGLVVAQGWEEQAACGRARGNRLCAQSRLIPWPRGLWPARLRCPRDSPGKNTGVGCHFQTPGDLPDPGMEPFHLSHQGSLRATGDFHQFSSHFFLFMVPASFPLTQAHRRELLTVIHLIPRGRGKEGRKDIHSWINAVYLSTFL